jgi:hypothetical protein
MRISIGEVDGDGWEDYCQNLLKLKYSSSEGYQEVPARYGGDLGIEGFTQTGIAFQCYCPEGEPTSKELYNGQRDKVTRDIKKLLKYETELKKLLGTILIEEWQFLTPRYESKDLIAHCTKKTQEVRASGKSHVSKNFKILIRTESDFIPEREMLTSSGHGRISPEFVPISDEEVAEWKASNNEYFNTLEGKLGKIIPENDKRNIQTIEMIKSYLLGQNILENIRKDFPRHYQQIMNLKTATESSVKIASALPNNPGEHLKHTLSEYKENIESHLNKSIGLPTVMRLGNEAIADWLIRCPLDFV